MASDVPDLTEKQRTSRQLERLLLTVASPQPSTSTTKRRIQAVEPSQTDPGPSIKKKRKAFLDSAVQAVASDARLSRLLNVSECQRGLDAEERLVIVTTKMVSYHEPAKYVSRLRLVLKDDGSYYIQVLYKVVEEGTIETVDNFKYLCEKVSEPSMKYCPGLSVEEYEEYKQVVGYDIKSVCITEGPFKRIASKHCLLWYPMSRNMSKDNKRSYEVICRKCVGLRSQMKGAMKRSATVTPEVKLRRQQANSSFPMRYLSPESLEKRKMNIKLAKYKEKRKIKKYVPKSVIREEKQAIEDIMSNEQLQSLISSTSECTSSPETAQSALRSMLEQDSET